MKKSADISTIFKPIGTIFRRFHLTIFIVFIVAGLAFAVYTFNNILTESSTDNSYTSSIGAGSIDQATLQRINALHTSDSAQPTFTPPAGRIDPFSE